MKIAIIGAGNVGSTLAMRVIEDNLGDVILLDVIQGLPQGKALDISDSAPIMQHEKNIVGTNDYKDLVGADIVVVTAGLPRKPGMTREDLINKNASIIKDISVKIKQVCPAAILIVVTNPLDIMAYFAFKISGFDRSRVIGMAGTLDTSRFKNLLSRELNVPFSEIETYVLGCHGDSMVPLISKTFVNKRPLTEIANPGTVDALVQRTKRRGAEIVSNLQTGSAYYSPSAAVLEIIRAIAADLKTVLPVSAFLKGEYSIEGCFLGVPARIGRRGITEIVELNISLVETNELKASSEKIKTMLSSLPST